MDEVWTFRQNETIIIGLAKYSSRHFQNSKIYSSFQRKSSCDEIRECSEFEDGSTLTLSLAQAECPELQNVTDVSV